jgi:hypothetical protein
MYVCMPQMQCPLFCKRLPRQSIILIDISVHDVTYLYAVYVRNLTTNVHLILLHSIMLSDLNLSIYILRARCLEHQHILNIQPRLLVT